MTIRESIYPFKPLQLIVISVIAGLIGIPLFICIFNRGVDLFNFIGNKGTEIYDGVIYALYNW